MKFSWRATALLLPLALSGCRQEEPEAVRQAREERVEHTQAYSDQASLVFARQEFALAKEKTLTPSVDGKTNTNAAERAAADHIEEATMQLRLDADREQYNQDLKAWKRFSETLKAEPARAPK